MLHYSFAHVGLGLSKANFPPKDVISLQKLSPVFQSLTLQKVIVRSYDQRENSKGIEFFFYQMKNQGLATVDHQQKYKRCNGFLSTLELFVVAWVQKT